jgi:glycosyltransferase involved in cell wall biosynthesis
MGFVVFHPTVAPHVQNAALAMHEAGQLDHLATGLVDAPQSRVQKLLGAAGKMVGIDLAAEFARRRVALLPPDKIRARPWGELLRASVARVDRDQRFSDLVWEQTEGAFDRAVARSLHSGLTGVYGFEYGSRRTFEKARSMGLTAVYEMPAPEPVFVHELLQREREKFRELETPFSRHVARREPMWIEHRRREWDSANLVIAASRFTAESYERAGWGAGKVRVVPLGAPPAIDEESAEKGGTGGKEKLRVVWAGTLNVRKGAHYALEAWRAHDLHRHAELHAFGAAALPPRLLQELPRGVYLHGSIAREQLWREFLAADVLLFPTLCDGFGMVVTEAWSRGLPVITTSRAGASERLEAGRSGWLIDPGSAAAIAEAVQRAASDRETLRGMRLHALAAAKARTWADYRKDLAAEVAQGVSRRSDHA